ncbi:ABC transporter ATP-binding protein [uncultured Eubacterium sp.]|uniref:ABC transporter ATP-binding protein n=1 Tax=uncultured Eubacterium sp. TaxID=165185 RepID=UPI00345DA6FD
MQTNDAVKDTINTKENQEITATIDTETVKAAMQKHPDTDTTDASEPKKKKKKPAMEVRDLSFSYGKNKILKKVSLKIEEGKVTTIMGANGCGKSTLFSLMTKNLDARKGQIFLRGKNIRNLTLKEFARKVSIVQQYNTSSNDITVENLVAFGRTPHRKPMQAATQEDEQLIEWAMEVTGIVEYRDREISRLSGGQRQRVWIAMALAQNTKILFLDEPTTYLDIRYQVEILELVRKLNREYGITIVMVLHDINQAIYFSDNVIGLKGGVVGFAGDPEEVITKESIRDLYGIELDVTQINGRKFVLTV